MTNLIESLSTAFLLIMLVILFSHLLNKDAGLWLSSMFKAAPSTGSASGSNTLPQMLGTPPNMMNNGTPPAGTVG